VVREILKWTLTVVYLFAGEHRKANLRYWLLRLVPGRNWCLDMKEVDILRNKMSDDLLKDEIYLPLREEMKAAKYKVIVATPPCNTHTRAAFANAWGPAPCRTKEYPDGFPWLEGRALERCQAANMLMERTLDSLEIAVDLKLLWLTEFPEDLGVTTDGWWPASLWQLPRMLAMIAKGLTGAVRH
jgi:hypothetical protein